jgi:hypothetical protein
MRLEPDSWKKVYENALALELRAADLAVVQQCGVKALLGL